MLMWGIISGTILGVIKGDTRSLDHSSYELSSSGIRVLPREVTITWAKVGSDLGLGIGVPV